MLFYLNNLVEREIFKNITLKFQIRGHTRNSCDRGFGLFKQKYVLQESFIQDHIKDIFNSITRLSAINFQANAFRDWQVIEGGYNKLPGISKFHIFNFATIQQGEVLVQRSSKSDIVKLQLKKNKAKCTNIGPFYVPLLPVRGMKLIKQCDLYTKVRPFIPLQYQQLFCSEPSKEIVKTVRQARNISAATKRKSKSKNT